MNNNVADSFQETGLNPGYTFDNFVVGSSNRILVSLARAVVDNPGHNPLYIYGGVGLGKDHVIQAAGNHFLQLRPKAKVKYITVQQFIDELDDATYKASLPEFRNRYCKMDLLLLDDFQLIVSNADAQNEILTIFKNLIEARKQIIIGADRPPRALSNINEQLRTILEASSIADVQLPDYEMRLEILKHKALTVYPNTVIPEEVFEFIAHKIVSNIREFEAALIRVVTFALHNHTSLTVEIASQVLNDLMLNSHKKVLTPSQIVEQVSQFYSIDQKELRGRSRSQNIVMPRQIAMYIIRDQTETSLMKIGQMLGGRGAATVSKSVARIESEIETSPALRQQINTIIQLLYAEKA